MKTIELLRKFVSAKQEPPEILWERILWNAADLVKMAMRERNTGKKKPPKRKSALVQDYLFDMMKYGKGESK